MTEERKLTVDDIEAMQPQSRAAAYERMHAQQGDVGALDIGLKRPDTYEVRVTVNAEESRLLTDAARARGEKLADYIKGRALAATVQYRSVRAVQARISERILMHEDERIVGVAPGFNGTLIVYVEAKREAPPTPEEADRTPEGERAVTEEVAQ
jgi:hypothetical protein